MRYINKKFALKWNHVELSKHDPMYIKNWCQNNCSARGRFGMYTSYPLPWVCIKIYFELDEDRLMFLLKFPNSFS
jgi:hypothetical protein